MLKYWIRSHFSPLRHRNDAEMQRWFFEFSFRWKSHTYLQQPNSKATMSNNKFNGIYLREIKKLKVNNSTSFIYLWFVFVQCASRLVRTTTTILHSSLFHSFASRFILLPSVPSLHFYFQFFSISVRWKYVTVIICDCAQCTRKTILFLLCANILFCLDLLDKLINCKLADRSAANTMH